MSLDGDTPPFVGHTTNWIWVLIPRTYTPRYTEGEVENIKLESIQSSSYNSLKLNHPHILEQTQTLEADFSTSLLKYEINKHM